MSSRHTLSLTRAVLFTAAAAWATSVSKAQAPLEPPVKATVTGKFSGNGKAAAIKFVTVYEREAFSGKDAIQLIFSEKDPAGSKRPAMDAMFGKLGSSITLSVHHDGNIFGCEVSHSAHTKRGFSSIGVIKMQDFKLAGGNVSGRVSTGGETDSFGEKWDVDLTFAAPLPDKLRNPAPKPTTVEPTLAKEEAKAPSGPMIAAQSIPLPSDAKDVDYKGAVNQIHCTSARKVDAVAKELAVAFKQKGWTEGSGSLMGKTNAILKREKGTAKLTIMVQPAASGSAVKIFADGVDFTGAQSAPTPKASSGVPSVEAIEEDANKALKDALKGLPKGL
jgi:hypothetical protein